jgi:hypothetical protein
MISVREDAGCIGVSRRVLWTEQMMLGWFRNNKSSSSDRLYAEWIYGTLVEGKFRELEPERMLLPIKTHGRYHEKALLYREVMSLYALWAITRTHIDLLPVLREYESLLEAKGVGRGIRASRGQLVDAATEELSSMFTSPFEWTQRWLMEFRDNPKSEVGSVIFAEHCLQQYAAFKSILEQNRPINPLRNVET